ncbi:unnamed protein product [Prunus armeniaca]
MVLKGTQDVVRHGGAEGNTKLAYHKAMWLGTEVPKATQSLRARWCRRQHKMWLGTGGRRQHKAYVSQDDVARHGDAEGDTKFACRKAMGLGTEVPKATNSLHVARQCGWACGCRRRHKACVLQGDVARHGGANGRLLLQICIRYAGAFKPQGVFGTNGAKGREEQQKLLVSVPTDGPKMLMLKMVRTLSMCVKTWASDKCKEDKIYVVHP